MTKHKTKTIGPGSGRKLGSVSFISVSLSELNRLFKEDAKIPVWRKWAEGNHIKGNAIVANPQTCVALTIPIEVKETEFPPIKS